MTQRSPAGRFRRRAGWPLLVVGVVLFIATYVANLAGAPLLPFDQHHVIGQLGGGVLAFTGLLWATT